MFATFTIISTFQLCKQALAIFHFNLNISATSTHNDAKENNAETSQPNESQISYKATTTLNSNNNRLSPTPHKNSLSILRNIKIVYGPITHSYCMSLNN